MGTYLDTGHLKLADCRHGPMLFLTTDRYIGRSLDRYGEFSETELALLAPLVVPGAVVLDVGAHIGTHTVFFARRAGEPGTVFAFEPQRLIHQVLCANLALNGLVNVHARPEAVGRAAGTTRIPVLDPTIEANFGGVAVNPATGGEPVPLIALDDLDLPRCELIKIDVEGMEREVIEGASDTLLRCGPVLYVENDRPENSRALIEALLERDYRLHWHLPPLFSPDNWRGETEDIFPGIVSANLLGLPADSPHTVAGLRPVSGPEDSLEDILREGPATPA